MPYDSMDTADTTLLPVTLSKFLDGTEGGDFPDVVREIAHLIGGPSGIAREFVSALHSCPEGSQARVQLVKAMVEMFATLGKIEGVRDPANLTEAELLRDAEPLLRSMFNITSQAKDSSPDAGLPGVGTESNALSTQPADT